MNFIKNIWSKITGSISSIGQYLGLLKQVKTLKDTFPGIEDEKELRVWVIAQSNNFEPFAMKTNTKVDDKLIVSVRGIALNEKAFSAIYNLLRLAYELIPQNEPLYGQAVTGALETVVQALQDESDEPGDILTILAAIGLLLQVIRMLKRTKKPVLTTPPA